MSATSRPGLRLDEITVGAVVRLTGRFLRNTGQHAGSEGASRWVIVSCDCAECVRQARIDALSDEERRRQGLDDSFRLVAVNEPHEAQRSETAHLYADVPEVERPKWRHINAANLELADKLVRPINLPDAEPAIKQPLTRRRTR